MDASTACIFYVASKFRIVGSFILIIIVSNGDFWQRSLEKLI
ncbi:hypothetical protein FDUTEX481_01169 [Tolypothrix sp. PCC 7601]|nr:hypothetical protein FDUTEX481_01169 [Tolypothrix sp. PCC 7601]